MEIKGWLRDSLARFIVFWNTSVVRLRLMDGRVTLNFFPPPEETPGIDERIAQIDRARDNLLSALSAIDELKIKAQENREELRAALERINQAQAQKAIAEKELENIKQITRSDVEVFKKLAGFPTRGQVMRERFIGFLIGVVASLIATLIYQGLTR